MENVTGLIYKNNVYIADGVAEMYDGSTNTWKPWVKPPMNLSYDSWSQFWHYFFLNYFSSCEQKLC